MEQLSIVKIGGNVIDDEEASRRFLTAFAALPGAKLLVHGGGKVATQMAEKLGIPTQMVNGRRITDKPMLDVVTMVYAGLVNKNLVATLQSLSCNAIGLTGADGGSIVASKRPVGEVDYGFAGDIQQVNADQIEMWIGQGLVPIFAPITYDVQGGLLNTNADTLASALAVALSEEYEVSLLYCFEKKGVLADPNDDSSVISVIPQAEYAQLKEEGVVSKGMIPKLDNAFAALEKGVSKVIICHADDLKEMAQTQLSQHVIGTLLIL